jgi:glycosyl transferase family 25
MAQLGKTQINYEIVNAVDGRDLDLSDTQVVAPVFAATITAHPGVVGCALSHLEAYRRILNDGLEIACILEDDVVLPTDLGALIDKITPQMSGAEVVLLNFHSREPCRITKLGAAQLSSSRLLVHVADRGQAESTAGYLITRAACARMVKTVLPVRTAADSWGFFCREGAIDRLRCVVPMPVVQSPALRTTLSYYRPGSIYASVREAVASSRVPILYQALAFRRRRHWRRSAIGKTEFVEDLLASVGSDGSGQDLAADREHPLKSQPASNATPQSGT